MSNFILIPEAIREVRKGNLLIILDGPERENEADFFLAAAAATPGKIATMIRRGGGILCVAITEGQAHRLHLPPMVPAGENGEKTGVNFTVSVNARQGITTGVSAFDRAKTIKILADPRAKAESLVRPGHVFGLIARNRGLLERQGHTEAAVDLARFAGKPPAGVLCEIIGKSGRMARRDEIFELASELGIKVVTIRDLAAYVRAHPLAPLAREPEVSRVSSASLPSKHGVFTIVAYTSLGRDHAALVLGQPHKERAALVRVHSRCLTGDSLFSLRCDCGQQLEASMRMIRKEGSGVIIYLHQEGRGIGFANKIKAYALQDRGLDTVEANHALGLPMDARTYSLAADILNDLGIRAVRLLTNNPEKERQLAACGIEIVQRVPLETAPTSANRAYLRMKKRKMGHSFSNI